MCNTMSQALNKSSSPNHYKSIHECVRRYSSNETGCDVEGDSHFMKHQGPESSHRDSKSSKWRTTFYQISGLSLKKSIHPGEKTYNCSQYCKASNQTSELVQQWTIHNPQKEYKCQIHGKDFSNSSNLSRHRKVNIGRKPFKCTQCSKAFICHSLLIPHQITHTGEKCYKCTECAKPLFPVQILVNITEFIWGRHIINV